MVFVDPATGDDTSCNPCATIAAAVDLAWYITRSLGWWTQPTVGVDALQCNLAPRSYVVVKGGDHSGTAASELQRAVLRVATEASTVLPHLALHCAQDTMFTHLQRLYRLNAGMSTIIQLVEGQGLQPSRPVISFALFSVPRASCAPSEALAFGTLPPSANASPYLPALDGFAAALAASGVPVGSGAGSWTGDSVVDVELAKLELEYWLSEAGVAQAEALYGPPTCSLACPVSDPHGAFWTLHRPDGSTFPPTAPQLAASPLQQVAAALGVPAQIPLQNYDSGMQCNVPQAFAFSMATLGGELNITAALPPLEVLAFPSSILTPSLLGATLCSGSIMEGVVPTITSDVNTYAQFVASNSPGPAPPSHITVQVFGWDISGCNGGAGSTWSPALVPLLVPGGPEHGGAIALRGRASMCIAHSKLNDSLSALGGGTGAAVDGAGLLLSHVAVVGSAALGTAGGGAFLANNGSSIVLDAVNITGSVAGFGPGGAVSVANTSRAIAPGSRQGRKWPGSMTDTFSGGDGGALHLSEFSTSLLLDGLTAVNVTASGMGGFVFASDTAILGTRSLHVQDATSRAGSAFAALRRTGIWMDWGSTTVRQLSSAAGVSGGVVSASGTASVVRLQGTSISWGVPATSGMGPAGVPAEGGCVHLSAQAAAWMDGVHLTGCRSTGHGGAVFADDYVRMVLGPGAHIADAACTGAACSGGAVYSGNYAQSMFLNSTIATCASTLDGGCVFIGGNFSVAEMYGMQVSGGSALELGGCIGVVGGQSLAKIMDSTVSSCALSGTSLRTHGGGIGVRDGHLNLLGNVRVHGCSAVQGASGGVGLHVSRKIDTSTEPTAGQLWVLPACPHQCDQLPLTSVAQLPANCTVEPWDVQHDTKWDAAGFSSLNVSNVVQGSTAELNGGIGTVQGLMVVNGSQCMPRWAVNFTTASPAVFQGFLFGETPVPLSEYLIPLHRELTVNLTEGLGSQVLTGVPASFRDGNVAGPFALASLDNIGTVSFSGVVGLVTEPTVAETGQLPVLLGSYMWVEGNRVLNSGLSAGLVIALSGLGVFQWSRVAYNMAEGAGSGVVLLQCPAPMSVVEGVDLMYNEAAQGAGISYHGIRECRLSIWGPFNHSAIFEPSDMDRRPLDPSRPQPFSAGPALGLQAIQELVQEAAAQASQTPGSPPSQGMDPIFKLDLNTQGFASRWLSRGNEADDLAGGLGIIEYPSARIIGATLDVRDLTILQLAELLNCYAPQYLTPAWWDMLPENADFGQPISTARKPWAQSIPHVRVYTPRDTVTLGLPYNESYMWPSAVQSSLTFAQYYCQPEPSPDLSESLQWDVVRTWAEANQGQPRSALCATWRVLVPALVSHGSHVSRGAGAHASCTSNAKLNIQGSLSYHDTALNGVVGISVLSAEMAMRHTAMIEPAADNLGGGVQASLLGNMTLQYVYMQKPFANSAGGGISHDGDRFMADRVIMREPHARQTAPCATIASTTSAFVMTNSHTYAPVAAELLAGCIRSVSTGLTQVDDSIFIKGEAHGSAGGGAMLCSGTNPGPGVRMARNQYLFTAAVPGVGGAVSVGAGCYAELANSSFLSTVGSFSGGALGVQGSGDAVLSLQGWNVISNPAAASGSGISASGATNAVRVEQSALVGTVFQAAASISAGGCFAIFDKASFTVEATGHLEIFNATAPRAGAFLVKDATFDVFGTLRVSNSSLGSFSQGEGSGGVVETSGRMTLHPGSNMTCSFNSATGGAGCLLISSDSSLHTLPGSRLVSTGCSVAGSAGAVQVDNALWLQEGADVRFSGNQAAIDGGAIVVSTGGNVTVRGGTLHLQGNAAGSAGGAIALASGGHFRMSPDVAQPYIIEDNSASEGGGAAVQSGSNLLVDQAGDGSFSTVWRRNIVIHTAATDVGGGAVSVASAGTATLSMAQLVENTAPRGGAVFAVGDSSSVFMSHCLVLENAAVCPPSGSCAEGQADGGGLWLGSGATASLLNSSWVKNTAHRSGGGAHVLGQLVFQDGQVSENSAATSTACVATEAVLARADDASLCMGGAVSLGLGGVVRLLRSELAMNSATHGHGGAVGSCGGNSVLLHNATLSSNSAGGSGGGVAMLDTVPGGHRGRLFVRPDAGDADSHTGQWEGPTLQVSNNTATDAGAGMFLQSALVAMCPEEAAASGEAQGTVQDLVASAALWGLGITHATALVANMQGAGVGQCQVLISENKVTGLGSSSGGGLSTDAVGGIFAGLSVKNNSALSSAGWVMRSTILGESGAPVGLSLQGTAIQGNVADCSKGGLTCESTSESVLAAYGSVDLLATAISGNEAEQDAGVDVACSAGECALRVFPNVAQLQAGNFSDICSAASAQVTRWFVAASSASTSSGCCGALGNPCGSIGRALQLSASGDTIALLPGTYEGAGNAGLEIRPNRRTVMEAATPDLTLVPQASDTAPFGVLGATPQSAASVNLSSSTSAPGTVGSSLPSIPASWLHPTANGFSGFLTPATPATVASVPVVQVGAGETFLSVTAGASLQLGQLHIKGAGAASSTPLLRCKGSLGDPARVNLRRVLVSDTLAAPGAPASILTVESCTAQVTQTAFRNVSQASSPASLTASAFAVGAGSNLTLSQSHVHQVRSSADGLAGSEAGTLASMSGGRLVVEDSFLQDVMGPGAAVFARNGAQLTIQGASLIVGAKAVPTSGTESRGGAVHLRGSSATVRASLPGESVLVLGSEASFGGAFALDDSSELMLLGGDAGSWKGSMSSPRVVLAQGLAESGGALAVSSGSKVQVSGAVLLHNNTAKTRGGAVYLERAYLGSSLPDTFSGAGIGAATCASLDPAFQEKCGGRASAGFSVVENSAATEGGAIFSLLSEVELVGASMCFNGAARGGGFTSILSTANFTDSNFVANEAGSSAGGLDLRSGDSLSVTGGTLWGNSAREGAGGALQFPTAASFTRTAFQCNVARAGDGGGLQLTAALGTAFEVSDASFERNVAGGRGGGVFVEGATSLAAAEAASLMSASVSGPLSPADAGSVTALFLGSVAFRNNTAQHGGGVFCADALVQWLPGTGTGPTSGNVASSHGGIGTASDGCVLLVDTVDLQADKAELGENMAGDTGAVVSIRGSSSLRLRGGDLRRNCVPSLAVAAASTFSDELSSTESVEDAFLVAQGLNTAMRSRCDPDQSGASAFLGRQTQAGTTRFLAPRVGGALYSDVSPGYAVELANSTIVNNTGGGVVLALQAAVGSLTSAASAASTAISDNTATAHAEDASAQRVMRVDVIATGGQLDIVDPPARTSSTPSQALNRPTQLGLSDNTHPVAGVASSATDSISVQLLDSDGNPTLTQVPGLNLPAVTVRVAIADVDAADASVAGVTTALADPVTGLATFVGLVVRSRIPSPRFDFTADGDSSSIAPLRQSMSYLRANSSGSGYVGPVQCTACPFGVSCVSGVASLLGRIYFPALHDLPALPPASANASDGFQPRQVEMASRLERILEGEFATFACYFQDVCKADSEQLRLTCETGYRGAFCGACDPHEGFGYTREVDGCAECLDLPSLTAIAVVTALLMGLLITFFSICQNFGRRSPRKIILRLLLNHLQLVSSMNLLQVEFNSAIRTLFSSSDAASGSFMQLPTFQCFFPDSFFTQYALGLVFPVLVCLVSVVAQVSFVAYSRVRYGDEPPPVPEHLIKDHIQRLNIDRDGATDEKAQDEAAQRIAAVVKTTSVSKAEPAPAGAPAPPPRRLSMRTGRTAASNQAAAAAVGAASSSAKKKGHPLVRAVAYQVRRFKEGAILRQARLRSWESLFHRREIVPPLLVLLYLTYNSFARAVVAVFSCTAPVNGVRYLTADLNVQCGTPTHLAAVSASVVLVITVCLGTPALFAFILYKNRKALYDPQIYSLMGALFDGFDADHGTFAWQAVIMLRNFALVAVVRSISEPQLQLMGSILVTTTALCFHLAFLPYTVLLYNQVETVSLSSVAFAQMMSMSLVNGIGDESAKAEGVSGGISAIVVNGVGYMLLALHLCVFLMFVYFFLKPPPQVGAKKTRSVTVSSIAKVTQARNPNASMASSKKPSKGGSAPPALPADSPDTLSSLPESRDILTANPLRSGPSFTGSLGQVSDKLTHDPVPARKGPSGAANRSSRVAALADGKAQARRTSLLSSVAHAKSSNKLLGRPTTRGSSRKLV